MTNGKKTITFEVSDSEEDYDFQDPKKLIGPKGEVYLLQLATPGYEKRQVGVKRVQLQQEQYAREAWKCVKKQLDDAQEAFNLASEHVDDSLRAFDSFLNHFGDIGLTLAGERKVRVERFCLAVNLARIHEKKLLAEQEERGEQQKRQEQAEKEAEEKERHQKAQQEEEDERQRQEILAARKEKEERRQKELERKKAEKEAAEQELECLRKTAQEKKD